MKLQFYRVFVEQVTQLSLLEDKVTPKNELVREAFSRRDPLYFHSGERRYAYVVQSIVGNYIYASLAKESRVKVMHSPEEGFEVEAVETWPNVPLIVNTSNDKQVGQSVAVEINGSIFRYPHVQIRRLITELNRAVLKDKGFEMALHPITEENEFWEVIENNQGDIHSLEFDFSAPNLFGTNDSLNDELREARDHFAMTNASFKIENSEGELKVPKNNKFVNESIQYISEGGGEYKIRLRSRRTVSSQESVKSKVIDEKEFEIAGGSEESLKEFCDKLFSWLKH